MSIALEYIAGSYFSNVEKKLFKIPVLNIYAASLFFSLRRDFRARCLFLFQSKRLLRATILSGNLERTNNKKLRYPLNLRRMLRILTTKKFNKYYEMEESILREIAHAKTYNESDAVFNQILYLDILTISERKIFYNLYRYHPGGHKTMLLNITNKNIIDDLVFVHFIEILHYANSLCQAHSDVFVKYIVFKIVTFLGILSIDPRDLHKEFSILRSKLEKLQSSDLYRKHPFEFNALFLKDKILNSERMLDRVLMLDSDGPKFGK